MKKNYLYGFYDVVSDDYVCFAIANSPSNLVRTYYPAFANRTPLKDIKIYELGFCDSDKITWKVPKKEHSWDCYKFPENKAEALAPLGLKPSEVEEIFNEKTKDVKEEKND